MRWLVRRVHRKGKGQLAYEDDIHFGEVLTVGRGASQALFLTDMRVALEHARITSVSRGQYRVESLIDAGVRVNGGIVHQTTCTSGAQIELGGYRIELIEPPEDYEAAVEISQIDKAEQAADAARQRPPTSLAETRLSKRLPAWLLFITIGVLFLVLPMASHYASGLSSLLQQSPLPSRGAWQAGELASAHHFFGSNCQSCHSEAFAWVKDGDCLTCHARTPAHADPATFNLPELGEARCAHCHRDHNGRNGLIRDDQALCANCHDDLSTRTAGASSLGNATDFGLDHPQFKVALPKWNAQGEFAPERVTLAPDLQEKSGLKFPHDVHLAKDGVNSPDGRKRLDCASCHVPDAGGAAMQPVKFDTMCQSCHALTFDITAPERQVPHARIEEITYMLDEFYARRALEGEVRDESAPVSLRTRRLPGQQVEPQQRQLALAWARDKSRQVAESLFTGKACTVCHAVTAPRSIDDTWKVAPVRVAGIWFPKARFDHGSHTTMACADCHKAETSKASSDLLLPPIEDCRTCHAGEAGGHDKLESGCTSCHGYHESAHLLQADL